MSSKIKAKDLTRARKEKQSPLSLLEWHNVLVLMLEALFPYLITSNLGWLSQRLRRPTKCFPNLKNNRSFCLPARWSNILGLNPIQKLDFNLSPETMKRLDNIHEKIDVRHQAIKDNDSWETESQQGERCDCPLLIAWRDCVEGRGNPGQLPELRSSGGQGS